MSDIERYVKKLESIKSYGNYRMLRDVEHNGFLINDGGEELLNLSSNDYLGLATNPNLLEEFYERTDVRSMPMSSSSSRLLSGNHVYYRQLEDDLAELYGNGTALVYNSGYHANIGILPAVAGKTDLIVADRFVHASMADGFRLSEAECVRYRHLDYEHLRHILVTEREKYDNVFIVTESVFSTEGDVADLQILCELKREFDCMLYVDEAHAVGVRGTNGLGVCEEQCCIENIDFIVGTFGKALSSQGAFVICSEMFRDFLVNTQRSLVYTTALPPVNIAWTRFVLNKLPDFYDLRIRLAGISEKLREVLVEKGFETRGCSHIVPVVCGENEAAVEMEAMLRGNGFFVMPVCYPAVPKGRAMVRFSMNAAVPDEEYECLFDSLRCMDQAE